MAFSGSLDTNALLRLLLNDIPEQRRAVKFIIDEASDQFAVADTAIIEVVFVLERYYTFTRQQIVIATNGMMSIPKINSNRILFEQSLVLFLHNPGLSFEDCCLATYAELNDAQPLWTFDKKLAKQSQNAKLIPTHS